MNLRENAEQGAVPTAAGEIAESGVIQRVIERIEAKTILSNLLELAAIGGTELKPTAEHPMHYATNRLALSDLDNEARDTLIQPAMEAAGMDVVRHPLATIGTYAGRDRSLSPVVMLSHTDTVPNGDIYDGTLGVMGGIEVVGAMQAEGFRPQRDVMVVADTGEESASFGNALFGSKSLSHGLTEKDLDSSNDQGQTIREALGEADTEIAQVPFFGPNSVLPYASVELHVEQDTKLEAAETDIGVVKAIAGPERYRVVVGGATIIEQDDTKYEHKHYLKLIVNGRADHSGATPMGVENRADGLVETAHIIKQLLTEEEDLGSAISVGDIGVDGGAMNKVPGVTSSIIRIASNSEFAVDRAMYKINTVLRQSRERCDFEGSKFATDSHYLKEISEDDAGVFFEPKAMLDRQLTAMETILAVNEISSGSPENNVVGTVGTIETDLDGRIELKVDIRSIDKALRTMTVEAIRHVAQTGALSELAFGEPLAGSIDPVSLDENLVAKTTETIEGFKIGSSMEMFSAAGHDSQNVALAGIPSVMLFSQSNNGGAAHNPEAYTDPENLQKGVRALAALVMRLAEETD